MKKNTLYFTIILTLMTFMSVGCATYTTNYDYDPGVRFTELKDYGWLDQAESRQTVNQLIYKRIKTAVDRQLAVKGYITDASDPDFLIAVHGGKEKKVDVVDWGYAYRGYDHYYYGHRHGFDRIDVYEYEEGTLILDFVDAESRELIWRGSVTRVIDPNATPEKRERIINEAMVKILEKFPPPVK